MSSWYDAGYRLDGTKAEAAGGVDITDASDAPGTKVTIKAPGGEKSAVGAKAPPFSALVSPQPAFDMEASTHEALIDAIGGECGTERMMRSVLCGWKDEQCKVETIERLAEFEDDFSVTLTLTLTLHPSPSSSPSPSPSPSPAPSPAPEPEP